MFLVYEIGKADDSDVIHFRKSGKEMKRAVSQINRASGEQYDMKTNAYSAKSNIIQRCLDLPKRNYSQLNYVRKAQKRHGKYIT